MTLNDLLQEHPEYGDLQLVVLTTDGHYDWVGASGDVYPDVSEGVPVLVFTPN